MALNADLSEINCEQIGNSAEKNAAVGYDACQISKRMTPLKSVVEKLHIWSD